jgi:hypothetical protein
MQWLSDLVTSPLFALLAALVFFLLGSALTLLVARWSKRDREPCYAIADHIALMRVTPKVTIHYHGHGEDLEPTMGRSSFALRHAAVVLDGRRAPPRRTQHAAPQDC